MVEPFFKSVSLVKEGGKKCRESRAGGRVSRDAVVLLSIKDPASGCVSTFMTRAHVLRLYLIKRLINVQPSLVT